MSGSHPHAGLFTLGLVVFAFVAIVLAGLV
jgi:hypothetical protein